MLDEVKKSIDILLNEYKYSHVSTTIDNLYSKVVAYNAVCELDNKECHVLKYVEECLYNASLLTNCSSEWVFQVELALACIETK